MGIYFILQIIISHFHIYFAVKIVLALAIGSSFKLAPISSDTPIPFQGMTYFLAL